jgi:hypothetical protein
LHSRTVLQSGCVVKAVAESRTGGACASDNLPASGTTGSRMTCTALMRASRTLLCCLPT